MKIIHIVENLDKGAVENWLINTFLESRKYRPEWDWTFYCILGKRGRLDDLVERNGGKIIYSKYSLSNKLKFLRQMRFALKKGSYDILHVHHDYLSGFYLISTYGIKFKKRLLHIHNTDEGLPVGSRLFRKVLLKPLGFLAIYFSDVIIGISNHTLAKFVNSYNCKGKNLKVLYYGIDLNKFKYYEDSNVLKVNLGIPIEDKILLFSGRMNEYKNPIYMLEILKVLIDAGYSYSGIFVGEGDLKPKIYELANSYNISHKVKILGWRDDLAQIMQHSDFFVFPRKEEPMEGLGLVVVEAQAAGLPMFLTSGIPPDAIVIPQLARFLSTSDNPEKWAVEITKTSKNLYQQKAYEILMTSKFSLPVSTKNFIELYDC